MTATRTNPKPKANPKTNPKENNTMTTAAAPTTMTRVRMPLQMYQKIWVRIFGSKDGIYPESLSPGIIVGPRAQDGKNVDILFNEPVPGGTRPDGSPLTLPQAVWVASYRVVPVRADKAERRFYVIRPEAAPFLFVRDETFKVIDGDGTLDAPHWVLELAKRAEVSRDELRPASTNLVAEANKVFADA